MKKIKLIALSIFTILCISIFPFKLSYSNVFFEINESTAYLDAYTYVPTLIEGVWWMYVYEDDRLVYYYPMEDGG
ncbi:MAG TPA: hypothetical protein VHP32_08055 [Ignavibacteria bacterium]|nr:hypothetical protein [Ignavibacteria bacterium]